MRAYLYRNERNVSTIMSQLKQYKGQLLITLFFLMAVLIMPFEDYTERTFLPDVMNYPEEFISIVEEGEDVITVPSYVSNVVLNSDSFYFKKGTYEATFNVAAQAEGSFVEVYDPLYVNPDNTSGRVLASSEIPATGENIRLSFSIDEYVEYIQFRIISNTGVEFRSIYLLSQRGLYCDPYIYAALIVVVSALFFIYRNRKKVRPEVFVLLTFAAVWSSIPLCFPWLQSGHDMYFHYGRLFNLSEGLTRGAFPIRIHTQMWHGFTYMSPVFYPEFFLYPFSFLITLGMSPIGCYKLLLICINFATAGVSYYSFSRVCRSRKIGLIASFLYTLSMYRFINLYTRAAIGEVLATIFLPLLLLGMYHLFLGDSRKWLIATLAFTALFQSHLITTELAIGYAILFGLWNIRRLKDRKRLIRLIIAAVSTVLLNLWFILPLLDHMQYSVAAFADIRPLAGYAVYPAQFFDIGMNNPTGEAVGLDTIVQEMPYSIGLVLLVGVLLFLCTYFRKDKKDFYLKMGRYCLILGGLSLYASSVYFPWKRLQRIELINHLAGRIQFTARFLPFAVILLCLTSAIGIYAFFQSKESRELLFALCAVLTLYSSAGYFNNFSSTANHFTDWHTQMDHSQDTDTLYVINYGNDEYISFRQVLQQDTAFIPSDGVTLDSCYRQDANAAFTYTKTEASPDAYVDVSFNYYPHFRAYTSTDERLETSIGDMIRLRVYLPEASQDTVTVRFETPFFYRIGDVVSLLTGLLLIAWVVWLRKRGWRLQSLNR